MADRSVALTTVKGGINRQRTKGGALEDSLYDLVNGYVSKSKTVVVRPGTFRRADLGSYNVSGRAFTAGEAESANYPGNVLTGYASITGDPYGVGDLGSIESPSSYQGFPIEAIFHGDGLRNFTAGMAQSTTFPTFTISGYVTGATAAYWGISPIGSIGPKDSINGFPIRAIWHDANTPPQPGTYVRISLGRDGGGNLPSSALFQSGSIAFSIRNATSEAVYLNSINTGIINVDERYYDFYVAFIDPASVPLAGWYAFGFTPDSEEPDNVVWAVFGRDTDGDLPDNTIFSGCGVVVSSSTEPVAEGTLDDSSETDFSADSRGWALSLDVDPPLVNTLTYTFEFDPEDTPETAAGLTHGLMAFEGELHVFATQQVNLPSGFVLHVLSHPDATADAPIDIATIDFAAPFMGFPYVVATFVNGDTYHFWLQSGDEWQPDTAYKAGDIVVPSVDTGLAYQASRLTPANLSWAPSVLRTIGDVVEPTVYNDLYYTVVDTQGENPRSGTVEPVWPVQDGAQVTEDADGSPGSDAVPTAPPDVTSTPSPGVIDRYLRGQR